MRKSFLKFSLCFLLAGPVFSNAGKAQVMSNDDLKALMTADWQRAKAYTLEYMNTMPADKYSFKAVDSLRSFAQQLLHLATANVFLMAQGSDQQPSSWVSFGLEKRATAQTKDSVMYFVNASYDYAMEAVKKSDPARWKEQKEIFGFKTSKYALMQKAFEHQTHHRGQTTVYIRELNIIPPQEKLF
ncbi:MAG TPA: DinB family protein [Ferruginibacter sp.]|nr:DinB family protein [Ferruginibacter sp.]